MKHFLVDFIHACFCLVEAEHYRIVITHELLENALFHDRADAVDVPCPYVNGVVLWEVAVNGT